MAELWTEKYFPKDKDSFVGNSEIAEGAFAWASKWSESTQPPLLLWGQTGSGKTCLAYLLAASFNWNVVEINSSDLRSKDAVEKIVGGASQNASFSGSRRLILIDDVDALTKNDRGGASAIASMLKGAKNPIILTATDIYSNKSISALRFVCKTFEFKKINYLSMAKRLSEILDLEKINYDADAVKEFAKNSAGDMRSALLDLETLSLKGSISSEDVASMSERERQQKVFSVMKAIFKGTDFSEIRSMRMKTDLSNDMLLRWVEENIPRQYSNKGDVALAFDRLSRADIFNGRIYRRQNWGFLRYSTELSAEGVALSKEKPSYDFVMYQFPTILSSLSRSSGVRTLKKNLGKKIGSKTHTSSRKVLSSDLPFLKEIFKDSAKAASLSAVFELDENEIALLTGAKPDSKKVKTIFENSKAIIVQNAKPKFIDSEKKQERNVSGEKISELEDPPEPAKKQSDAPKEDVGKHKQTKLF